MRPDKKELASKYTIEHCRDLLEQNPRACDRLYYLIRRDALVSEMKRVENRDAVRMALLDGPKTIGEILAWTRSQNLGTLDMPLCNLILPALRKDGEVEWDGRAWKGVNLKPMTRVIATPEDAEESEKRMAQDWGKIALDMGNLKIGESLTLTRPADWDMPRYVNSVRSTLHGRKETRDHKWSLSRVDDSTIRVTKLAPAVAPPAVAPPAGAPKEKAVETQPACEANPPRLSVHAQAVLDDIDRRMGELKILRERLTRFYTGEETCQSS